MVTVSMQRNSAAFFQCITTCVTSLPKGRLDSCYVMDGIQEHEVVEHSFVTSRRYSGTSLFEFACIGLTFVAKRIIFDSDHESGRHSLEFLVARAKRRHVRLLPVFSSGA